MADLMPERKPEGGPGGRKPKRESRVGYVEAVPSGEPFLVTIVFRGAWVDGMAMRKGFQGCGDLKGWLRSLAYFEELAGVALGQGLSGLLGETGVREMGAWLQKEGMKLVLLAPRNARQAEVITEGMRAFLRGKP